MMFSKKLIVMVVAALLLVGSVFAVAIATPRGALAGETPSTEASPSAGVEETPQATPTPVPATSEPTPEELAQIDAELYKAKALAWQVRAKKARAKLSWLLLATVSKQVDRLKLASSFTTWEARLGYYKKMSHSWAAKARKTRRRMHSGAWLYKPMYGKRLKHFVVYYANSCRVDAAASLAVASYEGKFSGSVGDGGSSFGPWQLHIGGALPNGISNPKSWANSPVGIMYALRHQASVARGLKGYRAIETIVRKFERPGQPSTCVGLANGYYPSTRKLVAKVLKCYQLK